MTFPAATFTAPALPAGVTAALPGALTRIFALIAKMKLHAAYTEAIGTDLGVVSRTPPPRRAGVQFNAELGTRNAKSGSGDG